MAAQFQTYNVTLPNTGGNSIHNIYHYTVACSLVYVINMHCIAGNNDVELNLAIGDINSMLPNFILPTFNTCIKNLNAYTLILKYAF